MAFELRRARTGFLPLRRRRSSSAAAWATVAASGIGAGAILYALLDADRRARASGALRSAGRRASERARALGERTSGALASARDEVRARAHQASDQARSLAGQARDSAGEARGRVQGASGAGPSPQAGAAALLMARGVFGSGILRVPFGLAGLSMAGRLARDAAPVRRGLGRATALARSATGRLRQAREQGGQAEGQAAGAGLQGGRQAQPRQAGEGRPPPQVERVPPGGIEPGVAHASPSPDAATQTWPGLGGDPTYRAGDAGFGEAPDLGALGAPGTDDVARTGFDAPEAGAAVREEELGQTRPRDEELDEPTRLAGAVEPGTPTLLASNEPLMPDADPGVDEGSPELGASRRRMDEEDPASPDGITSPAAGAGAPRGEPGQDGG
ncbi:MAG: hypothetical protein QM767_25700 [Anaeromyxobacter sp.]